MEKKKHSLLSNKNYVLLTTFPTYKKKMEIILQHNGKLA